GRRVVGSSGEPGSDLLESQREDDDQRLDDDPPAHLRLADAAFAERNRNLADAGAGARRPVGHFDLEDVSPGVDTIEWDTGERRRPPGLEAAGQVARAPCAC